MYIVFKCSTYSVYMLCLFSLPKHFFKFLIFVNLFKFHVKRLKLCSIIATLQLCDG